VVVYQSSVLAINSNHGLSECSNRNKRVLPSNHEFPVKKSEQHKHTRSVVFTVKCSMVGGLECFSKHCY